jgi:benzoate/toluate 1,2-dioxygenase subunit alpha
MKPIDFEFLNTLVRGGRVHRSLYVDPDIFQLEMERIFGRAWVYVCHETQLPNPGDFLTTHIGLKPVIACRDRSTGAVGVFYNRCGHRGAIVCNVPQGNVRRFRCAYHGWVFETDGKLSSVPLEEPYYQGVDLSDSAYSLVRLPRVESYGGFVFASGDADAPDLQAYLGPLARSIDQILALSPVGEIEIRGGVHKYLFHGNWKLQLENVIDGYHPSFSHVSTLDEEGRQFRRRGEEAEGPRIGQGRSEDPSAAIGNMTLEAYPDGHSVSGGLPDRGSKSGPVYEEYVRQMVAAHGKERTAEILGADWHNTFYYPNLVIQLLAQHVRVVKPVAVDRTEVWVYPILLKGVPEEMNHAVIRYLNISHAAASLIQTDDLENFKRIQRGLATDGAEWVSFERGLAVDDLHQAGASYAVGSSELPMRMQYKAWQRYMLART